MKKLILKTALITLSCIIGIMVIMYGVFALFFPLPLARFLDSMGGKEIAVAYYKLNYDKTEKIEDLATVCMKIDSVNQSNLAEECLVELVQDEGFEEYCISQDLLTKSPIKSRDLFYGKLVVASLNYKGFAQAVDYAKEGVKKGYSKYNPFRAILTSSQNLAEEELNSIKLTLLEIMITSSEEDKVNVDRDIMFINQLLIEKQA